MSPRADLLALTPDDLAALSNRGTVKRAQRELEESELTCEISESSSGDLIFQWSDGTSCRFPAGKTVHDAICSSGLSGISRHIIRSVLAYQRCSQESNGDTTRPCDVGLPLDRIEGSPESPTQPPSQLPASETVKVWDPGSISDDALLAQFRKPAITQARRRFEQGVVVELTRGEKPVAQFLDDGVLVRFPVPGDVRYATADCAESLLPTWVPLAVWAFRALPVDRLGGLLCLQQADLPIPKAVLQSLDQFVRVLVREGFSGVPATWSQRLGRLELQLRDEGLVWPSELVSQLIHQYEMYSTHDARFDPQQAARLVGEIIIRSRAILSGTKRVPQLMIRGSRADRASEIAGGRLIGVGLEVRPGPRHTTLRAYLQESDSGSVVAVERTFADPAPKSGESPRTLSDLAQTVLLRGTTLAGIASSQLLLKSGKRTAAGHLILPRTASHLTTHPQDYRWEHLKPPFAVENFEQLLARLECLPPQSLRPLRCTENLHVIAVSGADEVSFDVTLQRLTARVVDSQGRQARLLHPFYTRGRQAFHDLKTMLEKRGQQLRFVSGHVRMSGAELEIQPICLVFDDGQQRTGVHPWIAAPRTAESADSEPVPELAPLQISPIPEYLARLDIQLSESLLTGLGHAPLHEWEELLRMTHRLGMVRIASTIRNLHQALSNRPNSLAWDSGPAIREFLELCMYSRLSND